MIMDLTYAVIWIRTFLGALSITALQNLPGPFFPASRRLKVTFQEKIFGVVFRGGGYGKVECAVAS